MNTLPILKKLLKNNKTVRASTQAVAIYQLLYTPLMLTDIYVQRIEAHAQKKARLSEFLRVRSLLYITQSDFIWIVIMELLQK